MALDVVGGIQDVDAGDLHLVARRAFLPHQQPPEAGNTDAEIPTENEARCKTTNHLSTADRAHPPSPRQPFDSAGDRCPLGRRKKPSRVSTGTNGTGFVFRNKSGMNAELNAPRVASHCRRVALAARPALVPDLARLQQRRRQGG